MNASIAHYAPQLANFTNQTMKLPDTNKLT